MLKKMIVQGLVAAGICAGGASLYSAHAQSTAGKAAVAQPDRPADTGYLTPGQGAAPTESMRGKRHHDDDDDDDRGRHSERSESSERSRHEGREGGR